MRRCSENAKEQQDAPEGRGTGRPRWLLLGRPGPRPQRMAGGGVTGYIPYMPHSKHLPTAMPNSFHSSGFKPDPGTRPGCPAASQRRPAPAYHQPCPALGPRRLLRPRAGGQACVRACQAPPPPPLCLGSATIPLAPSIVPRSPRSLMAWLSV